jgi:hypothetical protein
MPAGFPLGIPGISLEIDGAMQQAPHPLRQEKSFIVSYALKLELRDRLM